MAITTTEIIELQSKHKKAKLKIVKRIQLIFICSFFIENIDFVIFATIFSTKKNPFKCIATHSSKSYKNYYKNYNKH